MSKHVEVIALQNDEGPVKVFHRNVRRLCFKKTDRSKWRLNVYESCENLASA